VLIFASANPVDSRCVCARVRPTADLAELRSGRASAERRFAAADARGRELDAVIAQQKAALEAAAASSEVASREHEAALRALGATAEQVSRTPLPDCALGLEQLL
jgi:hypothetical protein